LPTDVQLAFQLAHAGARDAVHRQLDVAALQKVLSRDVSMAQTLVLHSAADSRERYLQRPDLGRRLDDASRQALTHLHRPGYDLACVIVDGLSALAIERNAAPMLQSLMQRLERDPDAWSLAPSAIVRQGRVALGDEVGQLLGAKMVLVLIGERPGLSSPDSMGLYLTWAPQVGLTDQRRNCISNVRPAGLGYDEAACKLHYLMSQARQRQLSGLALKDETPGLADPQQASPAPFLL
jgi:ethanolamine ammonia-lyase small subunit